MAASPPETPTLARRYAFKLLANMASVPLYLCMEAILPRALGPAVYGNYSFATSLFQQFFGFLDMGTSTCFYNSLCRRPTETPLASFYLRISLLLAAMGMGAAFLLLWPPLGDLALPDMPHWLAPLAAFWAFLTWWGRVLRSTNDALGATVESESVRTAVSLLAVGLLAWLFWRGQLDLQSLFIQQYLMLGALCAGYWIVSSRRWRQLGARLPSHLDRTRIRAYSREFFSYSHPLLVQALLSFFMLSSERWLLQWFDGSSQQGFFALSQKVSMACFLFVSAMTPLLMRELSIAWGRDDHEEMGRLIGRFAPLLYVVAAYFSCFTLVESESLVDFFGGSQFAGALLPVQIMALYPLHQGYGQLASSVFHATGRTRTLRNMTALECVYGFAAAWFLLAPPKFLGLDLGAAGLAIKTVIVQFASVNIYLWLAARIAPFPFWKNLAHQFWSLALLLGLAEISRWLTLQIPADILPRLFRFLLCGLLYTVFAGCLALAMPPLLGMSRQDLRELARRIGRRKA